MLCEENSCAGQQFMARATTHKSENQNIMYYFAELDRYVRVYTTTFRLTSSVHRQYILLRRICPSLVYAPA